MSRGGGQKAGAAGGLCGFHAATVFILFIYVGLILLLLLADLVYVDRQSLRALFTQREIRHALALSLVTSVITTLLSIAVAVPSAYALSRLPVRGAVLWDTLIDMTIVLPPLVLGVSVLVLFRVGSDLADVGMPLVSWLGGLVHRAGLLVIYRRPGIVLVQFLCSAAFGLRVIKTAFDEVDPRVESVALTLGGTHWQAFRHVTLPMIRPGVLAGAVLVWARAVGIFGPIMIVAGAVRNRTEVLPTTIYLELSIGQLELALAVSLLLVALSLVVLLTFRLATRRTVFGAGADDAAA